MVSGMVSGSGYGAELAARSRSILAALGLLAALVAGGGLGCSSSPPSEPATWHQDVAPILAAHCNSCHQAGGIGPFPLDDFDTARANARRMLHQIEIGAMPPFDAREERDCTPRFGWVDDPRLSDDELATLRAWVDHDFLLGEPAEVPAPPNLELAGATATLRPAEGFATSGPRDQFICYLLDPEITDDVAWLTGWQVRPELAEVVHHAVLTRLPVGQMQDELVAAHGIGRPYECSISSPGDLVIHTWVPGNQAVQLPAGVGTPLPRGTKLGMQVHYHPANQAHAPDRTAVDVRITSEWPSKSYYQYSIGNALFPPQLLPGPGDGGDVPIFKIPAGAKDHVETMQLKVPPQPSPELRILSVTPHTHLVATHTSAKLTRPVARGADPQRECLSNGDWNFDWQRTYTYDAPLEELPSFAAGDLLELQCKWDNSLTNPFVQRMLADVGLPPRPVDIFYGEETTGEMCVVFFGLVADAPPKPGSATSGARGKSRLPLR